MSGYVWVVSRYWLSRTTGKQDRTTITRIAAFATYTAAREYAAYRQERDGNPDRVRFVVERCSGRLSVFPDAQQED